MKQLEISKLMDEYTDTEFFTTEGPFANLEWVRSRVLATVTVGKRQTPSKKKLFLSACLAAVMVILMGATGLPNVVYQLIAGSLHFEQTPNSRTVSYHHDAPLMELEEGRLYFVLDGQRTDVTDQISEDTPYIYDGSDPEAGLTYYVILGGTPECYGWLEWIVTPSTFISDEGGAVFADSDQDGMISTYDYQWTTPAQVGQDEDYHSGGSGVGALHWGRVKDCTWLLAGAKQLQIPFVDTTSNTNAIFYAP